MPSRLPALAARAQSSHVLIDPVDTLASCSIRNKISPHGIAQLANLTGGRLFGNGQDAAAALSTRRRHQACSFRLSAEAHPEDDRRRSRRIRVRILKPGFHVAAPERMEAPRWVASLEERREDLKKLKEWGRGLFVQARLSPQNTP